MDHLFEGASLEFAKNMSARYLYKQTWEISDVNHTSNLRYQFWIVAGDYIRLKYVGTKAFRRAVRSCYENAKEAEVEMLETMKQLKTKLTLLGMSIYD